MMKLLNFVINKVITKIINIEGNRSRSVVHSHSDPLRYISHCPRVDFFLHSFVLSLHFDLVFLLLINLLF